MLGMFAYRLRDCPTTISRGKPNKRHFCFIGFF
jgi:hypothetical protein